MTQLRILKNGLTLFMGLFLILLLYYSFQNPLDSQATLSLIYDSRILSPFCAVFHLIFFFLVGSAENMKWKSKHMSLIFFFFSITSLVQCWFFHFSPYYCLGIYILLLGVAFLVFSSAKTLIIAATAYSLAHLLLLLFIGNLPMLYANLFLALILLPCSYVVKLSLIEWIRQKKMFDQAQWAAQQFTTANLRLQEDVFKMEVWSRNRERMRLARDIHDTVGHSLAALLIQVSAVRKILIRQPELVESRLERLESLVRGSIRDVREAVQSIRMEQQKDRNWRDIYLNICETFMNSSGIRINRVIDDEISQLSYDIGEQIYRILQEGLTNAFRHGMASFIDVSMGKHGDLFLMRISDNGLGCTIINPGSGLRGMEERIHELNGLIAWQSQPNRGFDLGIEIPWRENE